MQAHWVFEAGRHNDIFFEPQQRAECIVVGSSRRNLASHQRWVALPSGSVRHLYNKDAGVGVVLYTRGELQRVFTCYRLRDMCADGMALRHAPRVYTARI